MNLLILTANDNRHMYFACEIVNKFNNENISVLIESKKNPKDISNFKLVRIFKRFIRSKNKINFLKEIS